MKQHLSSEELNQHKQSIQKGILKQVTQSPLLSQFCTYYLNALTAKSLQHETTAHFLTFLKAQYMHFIDLVESQQKETLIIEQKSSHLLGISIICPDAQFLIFTLENTFKQFELTISKLFHPLLAVQTDKNGKATSIDAPKKDSTLYSTCYIECIINPTTQCLDSLETELKKRLQATQCIARDHQDILKTLAAVQIELSKSSAPKPEFHSEWIELLEWLANESFSFFGYTACTLSHTPSQTTVTIKPSSQLGILSKDYLSYQHSPLLQCLKEKIKELSDYRSPFIFDSLRYKSPVKRFENLMRVSIKLPAGPNKWIEHNFVGLLKRSSLLAKNSETPIIKLKIKKIMDNKQFWPGSHNYNQTIRLLNNIPKIELFKTATEHLQEMIENLLSITNPNDILFFTRKPIANTKCFLLGVIPNSLHSDNTTHIIIDYLNNTIPNTGIEYVVIASEQFTRYHIYFDADGDTTVPLSLPTIETDMTELLKPWESRLHDELLKAYPTTQADMLFDTYAFSFPKHHKARRSPALTLEDIRFFEANKLQKTTQFNLLPFTETNSLLTGKALLLIIYDNDKIDLFHFMPIFQHLNLYFHDELTTRVGSLDNMIGYIHAFRIKHNDNQTYTPTFDSLKPRLINLLKAVFEGILPNDALNGLVSDSELSWDDIFILQAYRNYLLQLNPNYTKHTLDKTLLAHRKHAEYLCAFFKEKFTPQSATSSQATAAMKKRCQDIEQTFLDELTQVHAIDDDYILKWFLNLIQATIRTNRYQHDLKKEDVLSLKIDGTKLQAPTGKAYRELFVFNSSMEGIHLRFGPVSRGGIRWSSRLNDYRSEVLGLASTQRVKNVVIVPNGSKGGFVIKQYHNTAPAAASLYQYEQFITGLLSITDSLDQRRSGTVVKPQNVVCYDPDDPYLVVAADKGTATFSDYANAISKTHHFWLDDAFASGGSNGFNHKELGITAKGAWECVKLHFLENGKDISKEPFTCIGIGDMSGDVFGNGMLLSKHTQLIAAFNHKHIFIDPTPDTARSFKERQRLFNTPASNWTDYNTQLLSKGGSIYERSAKQIHLSSEAMALLHLSSPTVNGSELVHAILACKTDCLWFGGIGTYIKAASETHSMASDLANDAVRIDAPRCQATVIGEGANLGITQTARLDLSKQGVRLNTDFIDNSAGVNISDYEVNLKIFLQHLYKQGHITSDTARNHILKKITPEIIEKVLLNNQKQHRLLSMEQRRSEHFNSPYNALVHRYIDNGLLDPKHDVILDTDAFEELSKKHTPLPRPLLALLQSLTKLTLAEDLLASSLIEHPFFTDHFHAYFPQSILHEFGTHVSSHPLKKDITAMLLSNILINNAGILSLSFIRHITAKPHADIVTTYMILDHLTDANATRAAIIQSAPTYNEHYATTITFENQLVQLCIDALLLPQPAFDLDHIGTIQNAFVAFKRAHKNQENIGRFIPFYVAYTHTPSTPASLLLSTIEELYTLFQFNTLQFHLSHTPLHSKWETEQHALLQKVLSLKKIDLISRAIPACLDTTTSHRETCAALFGADYQRYCAHLTDIDGVDTLSLPALSVIINTLNML